MRVRTAIAQALGNFQDPTAADTLIGMVEDALLHQSIRSTAVRALGLTREPRAVPLLIRTLRDPERSLREGAAFALRFFRETRVVEALIGTGAPQDGYMLPDAVESLKKLTGQTLNGAVQWQKWWADNKHTFEQQPKK
jgi:hypothetical protein